jgi:acyl-CoA oxidase
MGLQAPTDLAASIRDERIRPFLPLVYLAWSDGELTPDEIEGICSAVAQHPGIDLDCQVALRHWLNPDDPPSPHELELLRLQIVKWTASLNVSPFASVTELGIAVAEATRSDRAVTSDERSALADIDTRYGPLGPAPAELGTPIKLRAIAEPEASFDIEELTAILDGRHAPIRNRLRGILSQAEFAYPDNLDWENF